MKNDITYNRLSDELITDIAFRDMAKYAIMMVEEVSECLFAPLSELHNDD